MKKGDEIKVWIKKDGNGTQSGEIWFGEQVVERSKWSEYLVGRLVIDEEINKSDKNIGSNDGNIK